MTSPVESPAAGTSKEYISAQNDSMELLTKDNSIELNASSPPVNKIENIKIIFKCDNCSLNERCDYFGTNPPFAKKIYFSEKCYVMKDPFSPAPSHLTNKSNSEYFIVIGSHCSICNNLVCKGTECSFYYSKTFCLSCAKNNLKEFPLEIQTKIRKQLTYS